MRWLAKIDANLRGMMVGMRPLNQARTILGRSANCRAKQPIQVSSAGGAIRRCRVMVGLHMHSPMSRLLDFCTCRGYRDDGKHAPLHCFALWHVGTVWGTTAGVECHEAEPTTTALLFDCSRRQGPRIRKYATIACGSERHRATRAMAHFCFVHAFLFSSLAPWSTSQTSWLTCFTWPRQSHSWCTPPRPVRLLSTVPLRNRIPQHKVLLRTQSNAHAQRRSRTTPLETHTFGSPTRSRVRRLGRKGEKQQSQRPQPNLLAK